MTEDVVFETAAELGRRLKSLGWMACAVESCTGGLIARALTETPGSSAWFDRGFVTYTNRAKVEMVGVAEATLQASGAVSEATAAEMASGAIERSEARLAMAVTGIAGPGGAVPGKPVGTVCFGWAVREAHGGPRVRVETVRFEGDRAQVRRAAALHALTVALAMLSAEPKD